MNLSEAYVTFLPDRQITLDFFILAHIRKEIYEHGGIIVNQKFVTHREVHGNLVVETQGLQVSVRGDTHFLRWLEAFNVQKPWNVEVTVVK